MHIKEVFKCHLLGLQFYRSAHLLYVMFPTVGTHLLYVMFPQLCKCTGCDCLELYLQSLSAWHVMGIQEIHTEEKREVGSWCIATLPGLCLWLSSWHTGKDLGNREPARDREDKEGRQWCFFSQGGLSLLFSSNASLRCATVGVSWSGGVGHS